MAQQYQGSGSGAFMSGFAGGLGTGKDLDTQWDLNRAKRDASAKGVIPVPGEQPPQHQSLVDNIKGHTENFINSLIGTHFGQAPPAAAPVAMPPPAQVIAQPGVAPAAIPAPGVAPPIVQPMPMAPGVAPMPQRPQMMSNGGPAMEGYADGGPVNYEGSGAGAAVQGFTSGLAAGKTLSDQYNTKKAEDDAAAAAVPAAAEEHKTSFAGHIENFAHHLFGMGLGDNHVRNSQQALSSPTSGPVPSSPGSSAVPAGPPPAQPATPAQTPSAGAPSPAAAPAAAGASSGAPDPTASGTPQQQQIAQATIKDAAADPAAQQGIPQKTPAQSGIHSLSHVDWEQSDVLMAKAVRSAIRAGQDPQKTYESLNNTRMAFMQSSVLRNIGAANMALMNGDQKAVEQAIRNVNYYMPNGQDLDIQHAPDGTLEVRDPFAPPGPDGKQPVVPITAQHLQLMAQNAMDPMKVQDIINTAHTQGAKIAHEQQQDRVMMMGALAKNTDANTRALLAPALIQLYRSHAGYFAGRLAAENDKAARREADKNKVPFNVAQKAATDGSNSVLLMSQGLQDTAPIMGPDGQPSLSPAAGKQYRNADKIPGFLTGADGRVLSPSDIAGISSLAGSISAANVGRGMSGPAAAELAGNVYKATHAKKMPTHQGRDGKPEANVKLSADGTIGWLWHQGSSPKEGTWQQFNLHAEVGNALASGTDSAISAPDEADPSMEFPSNPADNEPAVPAPSNY